MPFPISVQFRKILRDPGNPSSSEPPPYYYSQDAKIALFLDVLALLGDDDLPLHSRFYLSQTCQSIRTIVHQDWPDILQRLPRGRRMEFWVGLAYPRPDYFACASCCKLHQVDTKDTPTRFQYKRKDCLSPRAAFHISRCKYLVTQHHIQLALKYDRLGKQAAGSYWGYFEKLMAPQERRHDRRFTFGLMHDLYPDCAVRTKSSYQSKIVAGRFIFQTSWSFFIYAFCSLADYTPFRHIPYNEILCIHTTLLSAFHALRDAWPTKLKKGSEVRDLYNLGSEQLSLRYSCRLCRTDFYVQVSQQAWDFWSWRDEGTETESACPGLDGCWVRRNWGREHVEYLNPPSIPHVPGTIENMYCSGYRTRAT